MPSIFTIRVADPAETVAKLPDIAEYSPENVPASADIYVCALGFEPRCLSIPQRLLRDGKRFTRCLMLQYETNRAENEVNLPELTKLLGQLADVVVPLEADDMSFVDLLRGEIDKIKTRDHIPTIVLDISVCANRAIFRNMKALLDSDISLTLLYAEADVYRPTRVEYERERSKWRTEEDLGLEHGVSDIRVSRDFPGQQLEPLPDCVIVFPSFKASRTNAVLAKVDPSLVAGPDRNVAWLVGVPHMESDMWRVAAMKEINDIGEDKVSYEVSTFSYKETLSLLYKIYDEKSTQFNISLSPLGSKLQALACVLFAYQHRDIRVFYAVPKRYNAAQYSDGCKGLWQINFGRTSTLRSVLTQSGRLSMEAVE